MRNIIDRVRIKLNELRGVNDDPVHAVNQYYKDDGEDFGAVWNRTLGMRNFFGLKFDGVDDVVLIGTERNTLDYIKYRFRIKTNSTAADDSDKIFTGGDDPGASANIYIKDGKIRVKHGTGEVTGDVLINDNEWHDVTIIINMTGNPDAGPPPNVGDGD